MFGYSHQALEPYNLIPLKGKINEIYSYQHPFRSASNSYVEPNAEAVLNPADIPKTDIRNAAIRALTKFMLTLDKNYSAAGMGSQLSIGKTLLGYNGNCFESLYPLYFEGITNDRKEIRQISVIGLHMLWTYAKSNKNLPTILKSLSTAMSQERHAKTLFEMCRVLMFLIFCDGDDDIAMADLVPVFECFQLLLTLGNENLPLLLDKITLTGVFVLHMYQPPMQPKDKNDGECGDSLFCVLKPISINFVFSCRGSRSDQILEGCTSPLPGQFQ